MKNYDFGFFDDLSASVYTTAHGCPKASSSRQTRIELSLTAILDSVSTTDKKKEEASGRQTFRQASAQKSAR